MTEKQTFRVPRRTFVRRAGLWAGGAVLGNTAATVAAGQPANSHAHAPLPRRVLGRTKASVGILSLGTGTVGLSPAVSTVQIAAMVNTALDLGINFIDTAPAYKNAEEGIGLGLGRRRKEVFLATKVGAETIPEAEASLSRSLKVLKTDHVDLVYFHSVGDRDVEKALGPDGVFTWLLKQKKAGTTRFVGISGHNRPQKFLPYITTDEVDVVLMVMNFADRYTYGFEEKVLPVARKHRLGVLAMKVFGGKFGGFANYDKPNLPAMMDKKDLRPALRYALALPGVAAVNIGPHDVVQLRQNVDWAAKHSPLSPEETVRLAQAGRRLAAQWGDHFGPATTNR
jgi:aryl-alcohol dehydrogenase-like predicted oxidoreductase